jgi:hypothetical protein
MRENERGETDTPDELAIIWLEDISKLDYVRQTYYSLSTRIRPPAKERHTHNSRIVGYAILRPNVRADGPHEFLRRVFWLAYHDRDSQPDGPYRVGAPAEAVDPRTVSIGVYGTLTERALGGALVGSESEPKGGAEA